MYTRRRFGNDVRKTLVDAYGVSEIVASVWTTGRYRSKVDAAYKRMDTAAYAADRIAWVELGRRVIR